MTETTDLIGVVVIDDNPLIRQSVERWLKGSAEFRFLGSYPTAEAALTAIASLRPRVALLDLDMPGSDTFGFLKRVAAAHPDVQVLMLSGHVQGEKIARALDCGAAGYIVKDEGMSVILDLLRRAAKGEVVLSPTAKGSLASMRV